MDLGVFGATGMIGQRVVAEARRRGHRVTGFTRSPTKIPTIAGSSGSGSEPEVAWRVVDVRDVDLVTPALSGLDVVVNAISTGGNVQDAIVNAHVLPDAARSLLKALERRPATRLIVVGGAGSLEIEPGQQIVDMDGFPDSLPDELGVPPGYVEVILAHREALNLYRLSNRNWTYLSPSAGLIRLGERTGRYRVGGDQLLVTADGRSDISAEDLAVAILDEIEHPRHIQRRFTVGY